MILRPSLSTRKPTGAAVNAIKSAGIVRTNGIRISKFHFNYARSAYHLAGSPNYISVTTNFSDFYKKRN